MTIPEVRRLILIATSDPARWTHQLAWSHFRRRHQAIAKHAHTVRRARSPICMSEPPLQILGQPLLELTETRWQRIQSLLPTDSGLGRPRRDDRAILDAMLWVIRTGASWNQLPTTFAPAASVRSRYRHWQENGVWDTILTVLADPLDSSPI